MAPTFYDKRTRDYCLSAHPSVTSLCNSSNSPRELKQLLTCTRAGLEAARLGSLPACSLPAPQVTPQPGEPTLGTGRKHSACHLGQETWAALLREKSHKVQPIALTLKCVILNYFYLLIVLSAHIQRNCEQLLSALNRKGIYRLPHFAVRCKEGYLVHLK